MAFPGPEAAIRRDADRTLHKTLERAMLRDAMRAEAASATRLGVAKSAEGAGARGKDAMNKRGTVDERIPPARVRIAEAETPALTLRLCLLNSARAEYWAHTHTPGHPNHWRVIWQSRCQSSSVD